MARRRVIETADLKCGCILGTSVLVVPLKLGSTALYIKSTPQVGPESNSLSKHFPVEKISDISHDRYSQRYSILT